MNVKKIIFIILILCLSKPVLIATPLSYWLLKENEILQSVNCFERLSIKKKNREENFVHIVLFRLKKDLSIVDTKAFIEILRDLKKIKAIHKLNIGKFHNMEDPRALSEYDIIMEMTFKSETDYQEYQKDERHIRLKENTKKYLGGPPATYDYLIQ